VYRYRTLPVERLRADGILNRYGRSAVDFFKLWPDKSYFVNDEDSSFVAYSVGHNDLKVRTSAMPCSYISGHYLYVRL
ncbi:MAG: hypothetical protein ACREBC_04880, partial [Pyrinomonadaceae bacterium]